MSAYSIAELSKTLNLTAPTLRYYEEIGLLPPGCIQKNISTGFMPFFVLRMPVCPLLIFRNFSPMKPMNRLILTKCQSCLTHIRKIHSKDSRPKSRPMPICSARWNSIMPSRIPWTIKLPIPNGRIMISATIWNRQSRIWSNYFFFSSPTIIIQY